MRLLVLALLLFSGLATAAQIISTIAGKPGHNGFAGDGGSAGSSLLNYPWGTAADHQGNLYIADAMNQVIRKITGTGIISTFAGNGKEGFGGDGGPALQATLNRPSALFVDVSGTLYFIDGGGTYVRKITAAGIITTVAGTGRAGYSGDGGPALQAAIFAKDLVVDGAGNIFLSENGRIRRIKSNGIIETIAGNGTAYPAGDGGPATAAQVNPWGLGIDRAGNLFIAEAGSSRVRRIDVNGIISTVAGNGANGYSGDGGAATSAQVDDPYDVVVDSQGNLFIAHHQHHVIRRVDPSGIIETVAGTGRAGYSGDGGPASNAALTFPVCLSLDHSGNLYITDAINHTVRKINICLLPLVLRQPTDQAACAGGNARFSIVMNGSTSSHWQIFNGTAWNDIQDNPLFDGAAGPELRLSNITGQMDGTRFRCRVANSCGVIVSNEIQLRVDSGLLPSISITPAAASVCRTGGVTFSAATAHAPMTAGYQWLKNGNAVPGANGPEYTDSLFQPGDKVHCVLRFSHPCIPATEVSSNVVPVQVKECFAGVFVPTVFTPNQDGKNDFFKPVVHEELLFYEFGVYNRWGQQVFLSRDPSTSWDGRYRGTAVSEGVFVWFVRYRLKNGPQGFEKGTVLLLR